MRHGKKFNHLSRKKGHREALLRNLAIALITHKRIRTTIAKAKALRKFIEPILTKSKSNTTHSRRVIFGYLQSKDAVNEIFNEISGKIADRPGGYVRILRIGFRASDAAEIALIELVDYNTEAATSTEDSDAKRTRRGRRKKSTSATTEAPLVEGTEDTPVDTEDDKTEE